MTALSNLLVPPLSPIVDDFNRADENPVSQGGAWDGKLVGSELALQVLGNQLSNTDTSATFTFAGQVYDIALSDCEMIATIQGTSSQLHYLYARTSGEGGSGTLKGYVVRVSAGVWTIMRETNAVQTALGAGVSKTVGPGDKTAIRTVRNIIQAWHMSSTGTWTLIDERSDDTYSSGRIGIRTNGPAIRFDDLSAGPLELDMTAIEPRQDFESSRIGPF